MIISKKMGDLGRCLAIALLLPVASAAAEETVGARGHNRAGEGEMRLVLTYKTPIEKRVAFRKYMESSGVTQFEEWRSGGVFSSYKILFAPGQ